MPSANNEEIERQLHALLTPAVFDQLAYSRQLGMRSRILNLPLRVADSRFIAHLLSLVSQKTLLILERGSYDFQCFANLMASGADFLSRLKRNAQIAVVERLSYTDSVKDMIVRLGTGQNGAPMLTLRVIEVRFAKQWYRSVTSLLVPEVLPPCGVAESIPPSLAN